MGLRDWFRSSTEDREIREEIAFHVDRATQENLAKGMGEAEARAEALRRFGDIGRVRRECREARGRHVPAVASWAAVTALAAVSFLAGYGWRPAPTPLPSGPTVASQVPPAQDLAWPKKAALLQVLSEPRSRLSLRIDPANALLVQRTAPTGLRALLVRRLTPQLQLELRTGQGRALFVQPVKEEKR